MVPSETGDVAIRRVEDGAPMPEDRTDTEPTAVRRRPSMDDVGRRAGVSRQTVSRMLNGNSYVSAATRLRVERAIRELGYLPNRSARSLAHGRTESVGLLSISGPAHGMTDQVLSGAGAAAELAGYSVSYLSVDAYPNSDRDDSRQAEQRVGHAFDRFLSQGVDGLLVLSDRTEVLEVIIRKGGELPIVLLFGPPTPGLGSATIDSAAGGRMATEHLLGIGHSRIVQVAGPTSRYDSQAREAGFHSALARAGLEPVDVHRGTWTPESGHEIGVRLRTRDDFTAVFCVNDFMALGLIHAFGEVGREVPGEISVVGYDDIDGAAYFRPPLTTVRQDFRRLGDRAFTELLGMIRTGASGQVVLEPELIIRGSTAPR
jgi:DNA-binding LacI/PurR family transcriptional regulator